MAACAKTITVESAPPPPALVAPLPPQPQVPTEATDAAVGGYIVNLRAWGREVAARYEALRAWAVGLR
ncbi:Rz1-like lysis system protein LysC [Sphingomonas sp.]|uniref:Rz1-like lysis system protein LysC n=1 Tax=Sphingomonas sp. TaxID=28214 RepID=UPI003B3A8294